jgi:hypothetical protein
MRYDFVILSRGKAVQALDWTRRVVIRLGLTLNDAKTSIKQARKESFDFLGYTARWRYCPMPILLARSTSTRSGRSQRAPRDERDPGTRSRRYRERRSGPHRIGADPLLFHAEFSHRTVAQSKNCPGDYRFSCLSLSIHGVLPQLPLLTPLPIPWRIDQSHHGLTTRCDIYVDLRPFSPPFVPTKPDGIPPHSSSPSTESPRASFSEVDSVSASLTGMARIHSESENAGNLRHLQIDSICGLVSIALVNMASLNIVSASFSTKASVKSSLRVSPGTSRLRKSSPANTRDSRSLSWSCSRAKRSNTG